MRKNFGWALASVVSLGLAGLGSASAADMAVKAARPMPAPVMVYNWTGCYIGGNVGGLWVDTDWTTSTGADSGGHTASGVTAGGQIGCNYQTGPWVFGVEGMFNWADADGSHVSPAGLTQTTNTNWLANVTARTGYAFDRSLIYVKGGGAWIDQSNTATTVGGTLFDTGDHTRSGWTVGAGYEYAFAPNWSAKIEYNYMDFGNKSPAFCPAAGACGTFNVDQTAQVALFGVNYRFSGGMMR